MLKTEIPQISKQLEMIKNEQEDLKNNQTEHVQK